MMNDLATNLLVAVISLLVVSWSAIFLFYKKRYRYWKDLGVPGPEPEFLYGNARELVQVKVTEAEQVDRLYKEFDKEDYIGYYNLWDPTLLVRNVELVKRIFEKDFEHFSHRILLDANVESDSIMINIFSQTENVWKSRRTAFSRLFTPKKLREYIGDMESSLFILMKDFEARLNQDIRLDRVMRRYAVRSICMQLYGLDVSNDEERMSMLMKYADIFSSPPVSTVVKILGMSICPKAFKIFKIPLFPPDVYENYKKFTNDMIFARSNSNSGRNDFLGTVIEMMKGGIMENEKITFEEAVGQIFSFFTASFDTTELTVCHAFLQLALHPEIQEKARQEVDSVLKGSQNITFDNLSQMTYLEAVICESLRMYPAVGVLDRVCTKAYKVDEKLTIPEGVPISVPIYSIQMDPKYYKEPEKFFPERFYNQEVNKDAWLPFGGGPRMCIGMRLARLGVKQLLAKSLLNYVIHPSDKMTLPIKFDPKTVIFSNKPVDGFWIKLTKREKHGF